MSLTEIHHFQRQTYHPEQFCVVFVTSFLLNSLIKYTSKREKKTNDIHVVNIEELSAT